MSRHTRKGFTLIELLVVISIIALLIAILLPALKAARESARGVQCLSGQRQVAVSLNVYHADSDAFVPYFYSSLVYPNSQYTGYAWPAAIWKQNVLPAAPEILICPSFDDGVRLPNDAAPEATSLNFTHFGYNYHYIGGTFFERDGTLNPPAMRVMPAKQDHIAKPSETYLLMDTLARLTTAVGITQGGYVINSSVASSQTFVPNARHGAGRKVLNIAYADAHVAPLILADRLFPYDDVGTRLDADNKWDRW